MSYNLIKATDTWMTRTQFGLPRAKTFYPSEASVTWKDEHGLIRCAGQCLRQSWYRITGKEGGASYDAYSEWIFALGKAVEEILVEQWKQMGIWVANNVKFYDEQKNISGELDVVLAEPDGTLFGVECKSFAGYQATKSIIGNKSVQGGPKDNHLLQCLIYVDLCKRLGLIDYFKIIYYARDSGKRKEFNISLVQDGESLRPMINGVIDYRFTMEDIYDRYEQLANYIEKNEMPPRDYSIAWPAEKVEIYKDIGEVSKTAYADWKRNPQKNPIGDWNCNYCNFKKVCWNQ